jgi:superfamily II DNA or RNA helicase
LNLKFLIAKLNSWKEFKNALDPLSKLEKGKAFEELTKYYLLCNTTYSNTLKHVWLQKEVPPSVIKKLNLPSNDQGIDLIAETKDGLFWAIQCKYLQDEDTRLSHRTISTFTSLSTGIAKNITYCLVATTADDYAKIYKGNKNIGFINADVWNKLDKEFFSRVRTALAGKQVTYKPYKPKKHQVKAIKEAKKYFIEEKRTKGKLVFPCGAGKSLTGYWIKNELKSNSTIVAVPSLSLVKQTLEVYLRESVANKDKIEWLCVCSDEGIGKNDDVVVHTNEIGVPCITDKKFIANWLIANKNKKTVIFTTYQSGRTIADAAKEAKVTFDLGIMDEAHKTVGNQDKLFSYLLFDKNINIARRIFMTATERRYAGSSDNILSMDDENIYGDTFTQMPFKEAISEGILSDYKIITLFISDKEVREIIQKNAFVKPEGKEWDEETEARTLASLIALRKAMQQFPIHHAVTFHSSIKKAEAFEKSQSVFTKAFPEYKKVDSFHVSGAMPTSVRSKLVDEFAASTKGIITNAKCLTEGVDVPNIDCVLFADPRKSTVDIVQAVGRALRKKDGKQFGYVILPVFTKSKSKEEIIESEEFKDILTTLRALASNDERIIEFFRDKSKNQNQKSSLKDGLVQFDIDENIIENINEKDLVNSLELKTWDRLAKLSWMPFEEAREYVRKLELKNTNDWVLFINSKKMLTDIPKTPRSVYKYSGWISMGDWLGTGIIALNLREYKSFEDAKSYVHKLKLKSQTDWLNFSKSSKKPPDIPAKPHSTYKNKGWISMGDWLGTGREATKNRKYWTFQKAKKFVHNLKFKNEKEWRLYTKSGNMPVYIPAAPHSVYKEDWKGLGDWLGTNNIALHKKEFMSFLEAKAFVSKFKFKTQKEWQKYCKSKVRPQNLPSNPNETYAGQGWISYGDFLGTGAVAAGKQEYLDFETARSFVRKLNLKTQNEWYEYCKSSKKPKNIPNAPNYIYKHNGWRGIGDWLGTGKISRNEIVYREFENARKFARSLNLKNQNEWYGYCKKGLRPIDIPRNPERVYLNKGWIGYGDWLGNGVAANQNKIFISYEKAKEIVAPLNISTQKEWKKLCREGRRPHEVPADPYTYYKNKGWKSWADFLGKE